MNLFEFFLENPRKNCHLVGDAGSGKTTSFIYLYQELLEKGYKCKVNDQEQLIVPIYIKMAQFNMVDIQFSPIQRYIAKKYFKNEEYDNISNMLTESTAYRFVLLLDGVNELLDGMAIRNQRIYTVFENELHDLLLMENVTLLVSTRNGGEIFDGNYSAYFENLHMKPLNGDTVQSYVGELEQFAGLEEMITNPMLLRMLKVVCTNRPERVGELKNKYQLMRNFFLIDTELKVEKDKLDNIVEVRRFVLETILPKICYKMEEQLLKNCRPDKSFEESVEEVLKEKNVNYDKDLIFEVLRAMNYTDFYSIHDLIREYMALQEWKRKIDARDEKSIEFLKNLIGQVEYFEQKDLKRRTRNLDLAELFIGCYGESLAEQLEKICDKDIANELTQLLYQEVAGVYEDLGGMYDDRSAKYGWIAVEFLDKLKKMDAYNLAKKKNFLFYCCLNGTPEKYGDPMPLLETALNSIEECETDVKITKLYGKLLSNRGAYYYDKKWGNDCLKALECHKEALNFRMKNENNLVRGYKEVNASLRTIMSDYFQLKKYEKSYKVFKKIVEREVKTVNEEYQFFSELDEELDWNQVQDLEGVILRGMGSELKLLDTDYREEILRELCSQIPFVYESYSKGSRRNDRASLVDLYQNKLLKLQERNDLPDETQEIVNEFVENCRNRLEVFQ